MLDHSFVHWKGCRVSRQATKGEVEVNWRQRQEEEEFKWQANVTTTATAVVVIIRPDETILLCPEAVVCDMLATFNLTKTKMAHSFIHSFSQSVTATGTTTNHLLNTVSCCRCCWSWSLNLLVVFTIQNILPPLSKTALNKLANSIVNGQLACDRSNNCDHWLGSVVYWIESASQTSSDKPSLNLDQKWKHSKTISSSFSSLRKNVSELNILDGRK